MDILRLALGDGSIVAAIVVVGMAAGADLDEVGTTGEDDSLDCLTFSVTIAPSAKFSFKTLIAVM